MTDSRLLGTWRSDRARTAKEIGRVHLSAAGKRELTALFGRLTLPLGPAVTSRFASRVEAHPYEVVAKDADSVAILLFDSTSGGPTIRHIHFETERFWFSVGSIREFFRKNR